MREVESKQRGWRKPGKSHILEKVSFKERCEGSGLVSQVNGTGQSVFTDLTVVKSLKLVRNF